MKKLIGNITRLFQTSRQPSSYKKADAIIAQGNILEDQGKPGVALDKYLEAAQIAPDYPRTHLNIGNALLASRKQEEAIVHYRQALRLNNQYAHAHFNMGNALQTLKRNDEAIIAYREALRCNPNLSEAHIAMACATEDTGDLDAAIAQCQEGLNLRPNWAEAYYTLGRLRLSNKEPEAAVKALEQALRFDPTSSRTSLLLADAYQMMGEYLRSLNRTVHTESCYRKALELKPGNVGLHVLLGNLYQAQNKFADAAACFRQALLIEPRLAQGLLYLGNALKDQGETEEAMVCYKSALANKPDYAAARWALAMAQIPAILDPEDDVALLRSRFSRELVELDFWFDARMMESGHKAVGIYPFYLAYQEENNRGLLSSYGALCCRLMQAWRDSQNIKVITHTKGQKIRVAIVSAFIYNHSVWHALLKGWLQHFDSTRFELYLFHIGPVCDAETVWAQSHSTYYERGGNSLLQWVRSILGHQPDVLLYPEIGMDQTTMKLAALRLAPIQLVSWGHPETSGLPTMDYFISAQDFDPPMAQKHYSEQLISLPHLGGYHYPLLAHEADLCFDDFGIDQEAATFLCPGTPYKYSPRHDYVFTEIAKGLGKCQFIFFTHSYEKLSEKLQHRLEAAFSHAGMRFSEHVIFIPWLERPLFYGLMKKADVLLDSIGFSGFNTAMQAIECGLPVVAWDGRYMRGRLASGILRRMGLPELIAKNEEDYIALAIRLARDPKYGESIRRRIETCRPMIFGDITPIKAFEDFLIKVTEKA